MHIPHHFILLQRNPLYLSVDMKDVGFDHPCGFDCLDYLWISRGFFVL